MNNPFLTNKEFNLRIIEVTKRNRIPSSNYSVKEVSETFYREEQQNVSMYKIGNSSEYTAFLFNVLTKQARDLFLYIVANLGTDRDIISLHPEDVCQNISISKNTYYDAISCLRDNSIITPYKRMEYWINPFFLFRGNRIGYYYDKCPTCVDTVAKQSI